MWPDRVGRRIKLRQLEALFAVAECGTMGKAAERLALSQPVISKAIADLERTLGARLLDRGPLGAQPTLYGRALLKHSIAIFR
ncbi:MAG TPA: LysR family transcriptional regulator [Xanthobacteraceae bacterium]|jgi:DNA-binding transcriptional LysR family regulator